MPEDDRLLRYTRVVKKLEEIYPDNPLLPDLKEVLSELKSQITEKDF